MSKLFFWVCGLVMFLLSELSFAQLLGKGTEDEPYTGTITWDEGSWTGDNIFAVDLTIGENGILRISPGEYDASFLNMANSTLTINGGTFIINPNASATIGSIENNHIIRIESAPGEHGIASLIHDSYTGTVNSTAEIKLYLAGGASGGDVPFWHYISMPFGGVTAESFSTLDLAQYIENRSTGFDNYSGWVAYDGYVYSTGLISGPTFSTLELGKGYNYYSGGSYVFTLTGIINYSAKMEYLSYSGSADYQGFNLIGNPFASCLDWEYLINQNKTYNIKDAIYFTNRGMVAAYVGGVGVNGGTGNIPPLQGFFVKATGEEAYVDFDPSARTHSPDQMRYKKKGSGKHQQKTDTISFFRLRIIQQLDSSELVVRFNKKATTEFDKNLDAYTFGRKMGNINIWTTTGNTDYCINALPFPENTVEIPVGINIKIPGTFRLESNEIRNLDIYKIVIKDTYTNKIADLKQGEFIEFTSDAGMIEDRFILILTKSSSAISDISDAGEKFSIYFGGDKIINIRLLQDDDATSGSVAVYDLTGRRIYNQDNVEWLARGDLRQIILTNAYSGLYMVEIKTDNARFVEKVILK